MILIRSLTINLFPHHICIFHFLSQVEETSCCSCCRPCQRTNGDPWHLWANEGLLTLPHYSLGFCTQIKDNSSFQQAAQCPRIFDFRNLALFACCLLLESSSAGYTCVEQVSHVAWAGKLGEGKSERREKFYNTGIIYTVPQLKRTVSDVRIPSWGCCMLSSCWV